MRSYLNRHAPTDSGEEAELLYFSGIFLHELGEFEAAADCFLRILNSKPQPKEFASFDVGILGHKARHRLSQVYSDAQKTQRAEELLLEVTKERPDYIPGVADLAQLWIQTGRGHKAKPLIDKLQESGAVPDAIYLEGLLLAHQGQLEEGAERYRKALELDPGHEVALLELAQTQAKAGKDDKAEASLRRLLKRNPKAAQAYHCLAEIHFGQESLKAALQAVDEALALRPHGKRSRELREKILERLGKESESGTSAQKSKEPNEPPKERGFEP